MAEIVNERKEGNEKSIKEINFNSLIEGKNFYPSPHAWEDQVLYFLMLDRFSDDKEQGYTDNGGNRVHTGTTRLFQPEDQNNAVKTPEDKVKWERAGRSWVGGNLKGLESKMGYLKRLGITAVWVSPVFKQVAKSDSYHGYGIQNFLEVDPRFGSREDLKTMVQTAHKHGIYIILDIILNHAGDVFCYSEPNAPWANSDPNKTYQVKGWYDKNRKASIPFGPIDLKKYPDAYPDGGIWPLEFQEPEIFTRKGYIRDDKGGWDNYPEYLQGDFFALKDISLGWGEDIDKYVPSNALMTLCEVYKFWIAYADVDGFRVDTVKHMDPGATRHFAQEIHEFAQGIGKENFYLIGEITGGRKFAYETLGNTGLNAALGIDDIQDKLEYLVKGYRDPVEYFNLFRNSLLVNRGAHTWFKDKVVTTLDDHDQVRKGNHKARFCAYDDGNKFILNALALNVLSLGIPCIYYGSEQLFDGHGNGDQYLRESMFGGEYGAFRSRNRHFFNEETWVYRELSKILKIRRNNIILRRGRQYLRPISLDGKIFFIPQTMGGEMRSVVAWSRIFNNQEVLLAINTDAQKNRQAWVTIDNHINPQGKILEYIYSSDKNQIGNRVKVHPLNGKSIFITLPPAGLVILK